MTGIRAVLFSLHWQETHKIPGYKKGRMVDSVLYPFSHESTGTSLSGDKHEEAFCTMDDGIMYDRPGDTHGPGPVRDP